jgi:succinoglycan biosynthesis transport protein ExoP
MELTKIWRMLRSRKWIVIQAVLVVALVSFGGSYFITPSYEVSSKILIKKAKKSATDIGAMGLPGLSEMIIRTSADVDVNRILATSRPYIDEMVHKLQLRDTNGDLLVAESLTEAGVVSRFKQLLFPKRAVSIDVYQGTAILEVKATALDANEAMMIANTLGEIMVDQNQTLMRAEYKSGRQFLEDQMNKVKKRYLIALREITDFRKTEKTIDLKLETQLASEKIYELLRQKETDIIELAQTRAKMAQLESQLAKQTPDFLFPDTLKDSPQIEVLKKTITDLSLQLAQANTEVTEQHPRVQQLREQIGMARAELVKEIEGYRVSAPQLIGLERQIAASEAHLKGVEADIDRYMRTLGGIPDKVFRQESLGMELNVSQQVYRALLDSMYEIGMGEASTLSEIRVVERAVKPVSPASPKKAMNGMMGVVAGLVFGIGLALIMEYLDDTIKTVEDLKAFRPIGLIGTVPRFETDKAPLISTKDPNDPVFESYRKIRNYLKMEERPADVVLITSAGPGEGKSTTVSNLGISAAREGRKVVILDMDLRRASLHAYFDLPNEVGMADLLQGKIPLDKAVTTTRVEGLSIIASGPPFPDPGGLIESDDMDRLMGALRNQFDMIILDSAPLLVKSDALVLARHVEGLIIVVQSERTTRRAIRGLLEALADAHIRPLGFILNGVLVQKGKHFYEQHFYGYCGPELSTSVTD